MRTLDRYPASPWCRYVVMAVDDQYVVYRSARRPVRGSRWRLDLSTGQPFATVGGAVAYAREQARLERLVAA